MAETPPPADATAPASPAAAPVIIVQTSSPAASDAGVVDAAPAVYIMDPMKGRPQSGAAIFSTNDGRMPPRKIPGPPFPPVIARSDPIFSVVMYAHFWRNKLPDYYHRFFPGNEWTTKDLWDAADIHLEEPDFLKEVLKFITNDNRFRAEKFAYEWSVQHKEKLEMIGGDLTGIFDPHDHLAIVYKVFTDGETKAWPPEFLYNALHSMRQKMRICSEQLKEAQAVASPDFKKTAKFSVREAQQSEVVSKLGDRPNTGPASPPMAPAITNIPDMLPPPGRTGRMPPSSNYPTQPVGPQFSGPVSMAPSHPRGQLSNPKSRFSRSASGSSAHYQPPQGHGWGDAMRMPSDQHFQQPPGQIINGQAPHSLPHMMTGSGFVNNMNHMHHYSQVSPLTSPNMHPSQMAYPAVLPPGSVPPPPPAPFGPHHLEPAYQSFGPNVDGQRGMPFGDMTNGMQYPPVRGLDHRNLLDRRGSMSNRPATLYDPYGPERPEKAAQFKQIPNNRKGHRGSTSNTGNRGRKYSDTYRSYGSSNFNRDEGVRPTPYEGRNNYRLPFNDAVMNDKVSGCNEHYIGPSNETVRQLYVNNLPEDATELELLSLFKEKADAIRAEVKLDPRTDKICYVFIHFSSPAAARMCLSRMSKFELRGRTLNVSVPHFYYRIPETPLRSQEPKLASAFTQVGARFTANVSTNNPAVDDEELDRPQYSPQDARSDLRWKRQQHQDDDPATLGSPQGRKLQIQDSPVKQVVSGNGVHGVENEAKVAMNKLEVVHEQPTVPEPSVDSQQPAPRKDVTTTGVPSVPVQDPVIQLTARPSPVVEKTVEKLTNDVSQASTSSPLVIPGNASAEPPAEAPAELAAEPTAESYIETAVKSAVEPIAEPTTEPATGPATESATGPATESATEPTAESAAEPATQLVDLLAETQDGDTKDGKGEEEHTVAKSPGGPEETTSDDDQKNDLSFHSAQEAQEVHETQDEYVTAGLVDSLAPPSIKSELSQADTQVAGLKLGKGKSEILEASVPDTDLSQATSDAGKKSGAKQTQSLFPFAKPSKAQKQKEKSARKKDKRKEKVKGIQAPTKPVNIPTSKAEENDDKTDEVAQSQVKLDDAVEKNQAQQETVAQPVQQTESESDWGSKSGIISGDIPSSSARTSSPEMPDLITEDGVAIDVNNPVQAIPVQVDVSEAPKKKATHLAQIAVPDLGPLKRKPSTVIESYPLDTGSPTISGSSRATSPTGRTIHGPPKSIEVRNAASQDTQSTTSTPTVRAPSMPDTATTEFFTPMPTPVAMMQPSEATPPTSEVAKKKKKPKKKKKAQKPTDTPDDAFAGQFDEIAGQFNEIAGGKRDSVQEGKSDTKPPSPSGIFRSISAFVKEKTATYNQLPRNVCNLEHPRDPPDVMSESEMLALVGRYEKTGAMTAAELLAKPPVEKRTAFIPK